MGSRSYRRFPGGRNTALHARDIRGCDERKEQTWGNHTVRVAADSHLLVLPNRNLGHGGFGHKDLLRFEDDLVDILLGYLLAILEALYHVFDKLLGHVLF